IMKYLVNISKRRAFWSLNEDILKINDSDNQYAVSIKEDTVYQCLHSPKTTKERRLIRHIQERQYAVFKLYRNKIFWKISNAVPTLRNSNTSQMHNNIMAAGSRDRPPMLATGRYAQWQSRFLRYIDTRPNGDTLRNVILKGPYTPTIVTTPVIPATENSPVVPEQTIIRTVIEYDS
ncbi:hypothetical protein Tco_1403428, partial [Tanacetum coccineum]